MTHRESIESAASYALDALDREERAQFEAHLSSCAECRAEVAEYREVAGALAHAAAPALNPTSDALRERILREARQVRPIASSPRTPSANVVPARSRGPLGGWMVAAASLAAAVVIAFVYRAERVRGDALRLELQAARSEIARDDSVLAAFVGPEVHVVSLASAASEKPVVRVFWNHTRHAFVVTPLELAQAPAGRTYQLWAIRKGKPPLSMGTFDVRPGGPAMMTLAVPQEITDGGLIDDCALTVERAGGSRQPTETPRLSGSWRHVD